MKLECKECKHQFDPNDDDVQWAPPVNKTSTSICSYICPSCGNREDLEGYRPITAPDDSVRPKPPPPPPVE